jgi:diaminopimelate epimerase
MKFTKMHGAGNDFILLDNRDAILRLDADTIQRLCNRHLGVGADGVLLVESETGGADFRMRYYNADGGEAEMCGNGARCFAQFIRRIAGPREQVTFSTHAGPMSAKFVDGCVQLAMSQPGGLRLNQELALKLETLPYHFINTGVPHVVTFVEDLEATAVERLGPQIRYHAEFAPGGANANFVQQIDSSTIAVRTYERGVEKETLACGTGVVAAALIAHAVNDSRSPISVRVKGGDVMQVEFEKAGAAFRDVRLTGPATFVFEGEIEL